MQGGGDSIRVPLSGPTAFRSGVAPPRYVLLGVVILVIVVVI
jgi:hypothetical protein